MRRKSKPAPNRPALERWERFAREYIVDRNATRAYLAAGFRPKSSRVAEACASRLLSTAKVQALVRQLSQETAKRLDLEAEDVLREAMRIGLFDPRRLFAEDGSLLPPHRWPDEVAAAVASFEVVEGSEGAQVKKVKLWDKNSALEKLFRHLGLFAEDNAQRERESELKLLLAFVEERGRGLPVRD